MERNTINAIVVSTQPSSLYVFVTDFLNAPEEKYSVEKYGLTGEGYAESKMYALDFFENWVIGYHLTYNNHAELWFRGRIQ